MNQTVLHKDVAYSKELVVFDPLIGKSQAIQHPLAQCWILLKAAVAYHVERHIREILISRVVPTSPKIILCFTGEKVLGLPKLYCPVSRI